jgi:hypothetical protein
MRRTYEMIVVQNRYYSAPGREDEVLATRREASAVLRTLDLPIGEIFARQGDTGPDVVWECRYEDLDRRQRALQVVNASAEFGAVVQRMSALLERFERETYTTDEP